MRKEGKSIFGVAKNISHLAALTRLDSQQAQIPANRQTMGRMALALAVILAVGLDQGAHSWHMSKMILALITKFCIINLVNFYLRIQVAVADR